MKQNLKFLLEFLLLLIVITSTGGVLGILFHIHEGRFWSFIGGMGNLGLPAFLISFFFTKRRGKPTRLFGVSIFVIFLLFTGYWFFLCFPAPPEGKFILFPDIDTCFAPGYSDEAFDSITNGMSKAQVLAALQEPIYKSQYDFDNNFPGKPDIVWFYTSDGGCSWSDFAWRARAICFRNEIVVGKWATWCYD